MAPMKFLKSNTGAKVLSVLFAVLLWFNVTSDQEYGFKVDMPIRYIDPPSGLMIANTPPSQSQVYLSGSGKTLFRLAIHRLFSKDDSYITATLAGLQKGQHQVTLAEEDVFVPFDDAIRVDNILSNASFPVVIDRRETRTVPISVDSLPPYELAPGLVLHGSPTVIPGFVIAEGPEDSIRALDAVRIGSLPVREIQIDDTLLIATLLTPSSKVVLNQETVELRLPVERLRTKLFRGVPVTFSGFPSQSHTALYPDTLTVMIQGPESVISASRAEDITVEIDYRSFLSQQANGDSLITPSIRYPAGITSASATPATLSIVQSSS